LEDLDLAILRETLRNRIMGWQGADPRRSAEEIARTLGVSPRTVRRHIAEWRRSGFLIGYYVMPHPSTLGVRARWGFLNFYDRMHVPRALQSLALIDGTVWAFELPDQIYIHFVGESDSGLDRRAQLIAQLPGLARMEPAELYTPPCSHHMSRLDWRMVQILRESPEILSSELSDRLGISLKTTRARFDTLIESNAISYFPELGVSRYPGSFKVFFAVLEDPTRAEQLAPVIESRFANAIRTYGPGCAAPGGPSPVVGFVVAATSDAHLEDSSTAVRMTPGVKATFLTAPNRFTRYTAWTDEKIAALIETLEPRAKRGDSRPPDPPRS
jgi:DNA-binding Lrp family transcriptional regulator